MLLPFHLNILTQVQIYFQLLYMYIIVCEVLLKTHKELFL